MPNVLNEISQYWPECAIPIVMVLVLCSGFYLFAHIRWFVPHAMKKLVTEHSAEVDALQAQMKAVENTKDYELLKLRDEKGQIGDEFISLFSTTEQLQEDIIKVRDVAAFFGMDLHAYISRSILQTKIIRSINRIYDKGDVEGLLTERILRDRNRRRTIGSFLSEQIGEENLRMIPGYHRFCERRNQIAEEES